MLGVSISTFCAIHSNIIVIFYLSLPYRHAETMNWDTPRIGRISYAALEKEVAVTKVEVKK